MMVFAGSDGFWKYEEEPLPLPPDEPKPILLGPGNRNEESCVKARRLHVAIGESNVAGIRAC